MVHSYHHTRDYRGFTPMAWNESEQKLVRLANPGNRFIMGTELEYSFDIGCCDAEDIEALGYDPEWYDPDDVVEAISDVLEDSMGDLIGVEHDGSVDSGFECVSQPMTLMAHINSNWIQRLCNFVNTYCAIDGDNGMHVHVSRAGLGDTVFEQERVIAKMALMLDIYENNFMDLARRDYVESGWANPMEMAGYSDDVDDLCERLHYYSDDRYYSINTTNVNTIEFRIFASTTSAFEIKATFELVHALAMYCMNKTLYEIREGSWRDFCTFIKESNYQFLEKYMRIYRTWAEPVAVESAAE